MTDGFTGLQAASFLYVKVSILKFLQNTVIFNINVARLFKVEDHTKFTLRKTLFQENA